MKTLYKTKLFLLLPLFLAALNACENDGEKLYLSGLNANELMATTDQVVLSQDNTNQQVLSFSWTAQALTVSNPNMQAPNIISTVMQVSTQQDFSSNVAESVESNLSRTYSGSDLNTIAKNLGLKPDVATPLYFRLKSSVGNNMDPVYSNILTVNVTPFSIDMSIGYILDANKADTGNTLYSSASDGVYTGFMGATAWYNFFMKEGDGTIWGNDAVTQTPFALSSASDSWNFWFPGQSGCYYVSVDTKKMQWSSLYIDTLKVSGDVTGSMTFDRADVKWTYTFNATSTNSINIQLNALGKLYDYATGTDDASAISTPVAFAPSLTTTQFGGNIELSQQAGDITVTVPATGECTLTVDLSNPKSWICSVAAGSTTPVGPSPLLYVTGVDDGITGGSWNFNNFLTLFNEDNIEYAGVINVNSLWGYNFNPTLNDWTDKYTLADGDASSGTLVSQGSNNVPAPTPGLYLFDVSLKGLTYNLISVGDQIYIAGLNAGANDTWTLDPLLSATQTPGVYSGQITITVASAWGFQIHLDTSWAHYFGGSSGKLYYKGSNITDDASLTPGTYQMTVDLIQGTYSIN